VADELQTLNADLVSELTVKEHMATLGHASSEFVHDLRNPLTVVHGYAQLLEDELAGLKEKMGDDIESTLEYLEIISRNVKRCCDLTETWRNLGQVGLANRKRVKMSDIVEDVISGIEPLAVGGSVRLTSTIEDDEAEIMVDPMLIFRALQNLVTNALHSVKDLSGEVRVSCGRVDDEVVVSVKDNGCGIPQDQLQKIFEPYYTTKDVQSGTGLGLTITRKVMDNHGGRIEVESEEGSGTTFRVYLPVA
jgi:signal transduction histidine kinase